MTVVPFDPLRASVQLTDSAKHTKLRQCRGGSQTLCEYEPLILAGLDHGYRTGNAYMSRHSADSLSTLLCKWIVILAKAVRALQAENNRLWQDLDWEHADASRKAPPPAQSEVYLVAPEVDDILEKVGDSNYRALKRFLCKESEGTE